MVGIVRQTDIRNTIKTRHFAPNSKKRGDTSIEKQWHALTDPKIHRNRREDLQKRPINAQYLFRERQSLELI